MALIYKYIYLFIALILITFLTYSFDKDYYSIALNRLNRYNTIRKDYVIVIDYTKNIFQERLYVINMKTKEVVISSSASHAFFSGIIIPSDYSNQLCSDKSSNGNFVTKGTYNGVFGYSMVIKGLDKGINDNAEKRKIVFHSEKKMDYLWSRGCFATPEEINNKIINLTNNGCLVCVID